jgi:hypothetical protein
MKLLYISYDGLTDALGQSQILAYQKNISSENTQIWILSFEKPQAFKKNGKQIEEICRQHNIRWIPLGYTKNPPLFSTLFDLRKAWAKIKKVQKEAPFDIVHCRGYIAALLGEKMKKAFGTKFIFDMRGWWPDEKKESGVWASPLYSPVYAYFKKKEKDFFAYSDFTVSLTEVGKKEIVLNRWKEESKIGVVPTCTDLSLFQWMHEEKKMEKKILLGFPPFSTLLVYSGALGGNYPLSDIFLFIRTFLDLSSSHHCLILSKEDLIEYKLPERTQLKSVSYSEVGELLAICDLGLIYYKPAYSNIGRCPTKLGEYWACGVKAICPSGIGDVDQLCRTYPQAGRSISPWSPESIRDALSQIPLDADKDHLRKIAEDHFSLEKGISFYKNLYGMLMK